MPFVLDASVALAWCFEDKASDHADRVLDMLGRDTALVPAIWPLEIANALGMAERRGQVRVSRLAQITAFLGTLPISIGEMDISRALGAVLDLARDHKLSSYDAAYLELALRENLPLATADAQLSAAALAAGVAIVG